MLLAGCQMNKIEVIDETPSQEESFTAYVKVSTVHWAANMQAQVIDRTEPEIEVHELSLNDRMFLKETIFSTITHRIEVINITSDFVEITCLTDGVINRKTVQVDDWKDRYRWTDKVAYGEECELYSDTFDAGVNWTLTFSKEPFEDVEN